jgi:hypothetical protein
MKRLVITPVLLGVLFVLTFAAGEKRLAIEDALALKTIGAPQFSPDGKRLMYTLNEWAAISKPAHLPN